MATRPVTSGIRLNLVLINTVWLPRIQLVGSAMGEAGWDAFARVALWRFNFRRPLQNRLQLDFASGVCVSCLFWSVMRKFFVVLNKIFKAYRAVRFAWLNFQMLHFHWLINPLNLIG